LSVISLLKYLKYFESSGLTPYGVKPGVSAVSWAWEAAWADRAASEVSVVLMASEILAVCEVAQAAAQKAFFVAMALSPPFQYYRIPINVFIKLADTPIFFNKKKLKLRRN
jgi:hypothetical protein